MIKTVKTNVTQNDRFSRRNAKKIDKNLNLFFCKKNLIIFTPTYAVMFTIICPNCNS